MSVLATPSQGRHHDGSDDPKPVLAWTLPPGTIAIASSVLGGGIGPRNWIVNAQVDLDYHHHDPAAHVVRIAGGLGLGPEGGVGLLTAASVLAATTSEEAGVECAATVGVSTPTWAAAPDDTWSRWTPGTINIVGWVPVPLSPAALVNAVVTATEAKSQSLAEAKVPGTGTASDAIVVCCPEGATEPYGGPRSEWGARLARVVHSSVSSGIAASLKARR